MSRILKREIPKTMFLDEENNIKVTMMSCPDPVQAKRMFVNTCYGHSNPNSFDNMSELAQENALNTVVSEGTLPKGLEMLGKFVFLIENISLTITHCLVRHRFFTILQRSTAVDDLRHENFVMPRAFARDEEFYTKVKRWYWLGKQLFCDAVDNKEISVQNARLFIPKNNCNHMFIGCDLKSLREAYGQRACTCEEPIQCNIIFNKMKDLVCEKFHYLKDYFVSNCESGRCLHSKSGSECNIVFKRNELHKKFLPSDYDPDKSDRVLHDKTRDEMNKGPEIETEFFIGPSKVSNDEYDKGEIITVIKEDPALKNKREFEEKNK